MLPLLISHQACECMQQKHWLRQTNPSPYPDQDLDCDGPSLTKIQTLSRAGATYLISVISSTISSDEVPWQAIIESLHAGLLFLMYCEVGHAGDLNPLPLPRSGLWA